MDKEYTIEDAVRNALKEAKRKDAEGLLFNCNDADHDEKVENFDYSNGDFETVYSLVFLYADDEANGGDYGTWAEAINKALRENYPEHFSVS